MSVDPFAKPKAGDALVIPAVAYSSMIDAAVAHQREGTTGPRPIRDNQRGLVTVENTTGADVPRFGAMGIGGPLFAPPAFGDPLVAAELATRNRFASNGFAMVGVAPTLVDHAQRFVIAASMIEDGAVGLAYASGLALARVELIAEGDDHATVAAGVSALETCKKIGLPLVWVEDVAVGAVAWALVDMSRRPRRTWGRITGSTSLGGNQWSYQWEEVRKTGAGYGAWATTGQTQVHLGLGYNLAEDGNTGIGIEGLGIDVDGGAAEGFDVQPIADDRLVELELIVVDTTPAVIREGWFSATNGFDGACP